MSDLKINGSITTTIDSDSQQQQQQQQQSTLIFARKSSAPIIQSELTFKLTSPQSISPTHSSSSSSPPPPSSSSSPPLPSSPLQPIESRKRQQQQQQIDEPKLKTRRSITAPPTPEQLTIDGKKHDKYCWICHKEGVHFHCKICPRSYHTKCINEFPLDDIICPECCIIMYAENIETRSDSMKSLTIDELMDMLKFICTRLKGIQGSDAFLRPVRSEDAEDYYEFIAYPMDIQMMEKNIKQRQYGSTEAFLSDAQWLVHNSIVFNSASSPYTAAAKRLLKVCRQELSEIETCPECYTNAHTKSSTWFIEGCKKPHPLVWAKLKGFPHWPAKAMKIKDEQVDVRFFGQHDRAWVNLKDCYMYSIEMPVQGPKKIGTINTAMEELNAHMDKLREKYGELKLAKPRTLMESKITLELIQKMLPNYIPMEPSKQHISTIGLIPTAVVNMDEINVEKINNNELIENDENDEKLQKEIIDADVAAADDDNDDGKKKDDEKKKVVVVVEEEEVEKEEKEELDGIPELEKNIEIDTIKLIGIEKTGHIKPPIIEQMQTKSGYRFNISKDISISAIEDNSSRKQQQQFTPGGGLTRPKLEKYLLKRRPNLHNEKRQPIQINKQPIKESGAAITLPGGTITVTPLTSIIGNGPILPISIIPPDRIINRKHIQQPINIENQQQQQIRRPINVTLPPTILLHMENCNKNINTIVKNCIEQIAIDILENGQSSNRIDINIVEKEKDEIHLKYMKELQDLKHNHDIQMREMRTNFDIEKKRLILETRRQFENEKQNSIEETKKKQWCAGCGREALFYCCWNTSYCGYPCQESHWPSHMSTCTQNSGSVR